MFHPKKGNVVYLSKIVTRNIDGNTVYSTDVYSITLNSDDTSTVEFVTNVKHHHIRKLLITQDGRFLVMLGNKFFQIYDIELKKHHKYRHKNYITCIAIHPKQDFIAVGDTRGEITFYYVFAGNKSLTKRPTTTTSHWHAKSVGDIAFDIEGVHMYSGGQENVLVIWQLETGRRDFLPRLGAGVIGITCTPDQTLLALRCDNNSIKIINARNRLLQVNIQGVSIGSYLNKKVRMERIYRPKTGLVVEPRHYNFVFNGDDGDLHFFSPKEDRHVMTIQVGFKNPVREIQDIKISETQVNHVVFSVDGKWMVTSDKRDDLLGESSVKFWHWNNEKHTYDLSTQYNLKNKNKVKALAYHPKEDICVTIDTHGHFKLWKLFENPKKDSSDSDELRWGCYSVGYYKNSGARACCFSADGSILAISYGSVITLWNPYNDSLLTTLSYPPSHEYITHLSFMQNIPYLVSITKCRIFVWDVTSCKLVWSLLINPELITFDSHSDHFAIFTRTPLDDTQNDEEKGNVKSHKNFVLLFSAKSAIPVGYWILNTSHVKAIAFLPNKLKTINPHLSKTSSLVYMNGLNEFKILQEKSNLANSNANKRRRRRNKNRNNLDKTTPHNGEYLDKINSSKLTEGTSVFQLMYGNNAVQELPTVSSSISLPKVAGNRKTSSKSLTIEQQHASKLAEQFLGELYQLDNNNIPTPSNLYQQFADALVIKTTSKQNFK